jgi:hypothetical protein
VPVIAPFSAGEEVVGLKPLPQTATSQQKLDRLVELRKSVPGKTAQICYRNTASAELVSQAIQQRDDIAANKNNKDYVMPTLLYQLPDTPCGPVTIKSDKRSADEKKQADNQKLFDKTFNKEVDPVQGIVTVRIVGINTDVSYQGGLSATNIISSVFSSTMGTGWFSPNEAMDQNEITQRIRGGTTSSFPPGNLAYYAEFNSLKAATDFMKKYSCDVNQTGPGMSPSRLAIACADKGKPFNMSSYGNSAGAIEEFRSGIWKVSRYAILIIVSVAALVMMGNVGKIIADSRRETSVFRALGAKRLDITQVYLTYTMLVSLLVALCATIFGSVGAYTLNQHYSQELSIQAIITYSAQDVHKQFTIFGFNPLYVGAVILLAILSGLLSASIPLLTNMRRNPIRDMRDDS